MTKKNVQDAMWHYTVKYIFSERAGVNGIAEARLKDMKAEGHKFELREGETLDDLCLSVSLLMEPLPDVRLERIFEEVRVFYNICNEKARPRIYVPQETA